MGIKNRRKKRMRSGGNHEKKKAIKCQSVNVH